MNISTFVIHIHIKVDIRGEVDIIRKVQAYRIPSGLVLFRTGKALLKMGAIVSKLFERGNNALLPSLKTKQTRTL